MDFVSEIHENLQEKVHILALAFTVGVFHHRNQIWFQHDFTRPANVLYWERHFYTKRKSLVKKQFSHGRRWLEVTGDGDLWVVHFKLIRTNTCLSAPQSTDLVLCQYYKHFYPPLMFYLLVCRSPLSAVLISRLSHTLTLSKRTAIPIVYK